MAFSFPAIRNSGFQHPHHTTPPPVCQYVNPKLFRNSVKAKNSRADFRFSGFPRSLFSIGTYTNLKLKRERGFLKETQSSKLLGKNFKNTLVQLSSQSAARGNVQRVFSGSAFSHDFIRFPF